MDVCGFCKNGSDLVQQVNVWKPKDGFQLPLKFQNSFRGDFHKKIIKMGIMTDTGIGGVINSGHKRNYAILAKMLNLEWKPIPSRSGKKYWFQTYARMANKKKVDLIGPGWELKYNLIRPWLSFSNPYTELDGYRIVSVEPKKEISQSSIYKAFDWQTWFLILFTLVLSAIMLHIIKKITRTPDKPADLQNSIWELMVI